MQLGNLILKRPAVMGVLNVTPDSFSDGGRFAERDAALRQAEAIQQGGADILDIGGESTRPGAAEVPVARELERVIPLIEALQGVVDIPISIDTSKPEVMRAAVSAGAGMVNDIYALRASDAVKTVAALDVPVCLMHMLGKPRTMQDNPVYQDVTQEVGLFLAERLECCVGAGIARDRILLDPGFGFGKSLDHNLELLTQLRQLTDLGQPLVVGLSRKSMLGALTGKAIAHRMPASIAAAVIAVMHGAAIVRVHDVIETVDALRIAAACLEPGMME